MDIFTENSTRQLGSYSRTTARRASQAQHVSYLSSVTEKEKGGGVDLVKLNDLSSLSKKGFGYVIVALCVAPSLLLILISGVTAPALVNGCYGCESGTFGFVLLGVQISLIVIIDGIH